jgi:RNA polymerase sigma-70 factor (ECF subfamily)
LQKEKDLIQRLVHPKTQQDAFKELVHIYQKPLYFHIRNIALNHDDSDDILQNTFIRVFENLSEFNGESKLFSWLYRIATNEAVNYIQKKAKRNGFTYENFQTHIAGNLLAESYFDGDDVQMKLQKAISILPERQQLVFKMKYFEELKYEEIADILGMSVGGLKSTYHLAVKKIEEFVNKM